MYVVYGSVGQSKASKPKFPVQLQFLFLSRVYQELKNNISKHNTQMLLFVLYCPGLSQLFII